MVEVQLVDFFISEMIILHFEAVLTKRPIQILFLAFVYKHNQV